ncbi:MAG: hypothetical protein RSB71_02785 [Bacilli bacterium]
MNYYPYFNALPYMAAPATKVGLFSKLLGGLKWSSIISGTQKTLGIVNQAIPLIKQAKPVLNNAKTMFKVMNEFKKVDVPPAKVASTPSVINKVITSGPTFFQ